MNNYFVTCNSIGNYGHALTRGKVYDVSDYDDDKYRITGNHGKKVWISKYYFYVGKVQIPIMMNWKFDFDINDFELIEVTISFTDNSKRWCLITTPDKLSNYFIEQVSNPPGINFHHLVILKTLNHDDIQKTLDYLDKSE